MSKISASSLFNECRRLVDDRNGWRDRTVAAEALLRLRAQALEKLRSEVEQLQAKTTQLEEQRNTLADTVIALLGLWKDGDEQKVTATDFRPESPVLAALRSSGRLP